MFRFRDDVTAITDREEFEICYKKIYPPELELNKDNNGSTQGNWREHDTIAHPWIERELEKVLQTKIT